LDLYFPDGELVSLCLDGERIDAAVEPIAQALSKAVADLTPRPDPIPQPPMTDLVVTIVEPRIHEADGMHRAAGKVQVDYEPAGDARGVKGFGVDLIAPIGPVEAEDLRWYLESYLHWPYGVFRDRATKIEAKLPLWGRALFDMLVSSEHNEEAFRAWSKAEGMRSGERIERRITIVVDDRGSGSEADQKARSTAAAMLLGLPWELLHDKTSYLFEGAFKARVRRRLPSTNALLAMEPRLPLRILLVLARPEEKGVGFLDPRASTIPLVEALDELGTDVDLTVLAEGTLTALRDALEHAERVGRPFQVVHFDGHGIYDATRGLGQLCFEKPWDAARAANSLKQQCS